MGGREWSMRVLGMRSSGLLCLCWQQMNTFPRVYPPWIRAPIGLPSQLRLPNTAIPGADWEFYLQRSGGITPPPAAPHRHKHKASFRVSAWDAMCFLLSGN